MTLSMRCPQCDRNVNDHTEMELSKCGKMYGLHQIIKNMEMVD